MKLQAAFFLAALALLAALGPASTQAGTGSDVAIALDAQAPALFPMLACCDSLDSPSSCWPTTNPADLAPCDPEAELGECGVDQQGGVASCMPVTLQCCITEAGAVWGSRCKPHEPGGFCPWTVVAWDGEG